MMARSWMPSPIILSPEKAWTSKIYRRPSIRAKVALTRTGLPTGLGARCRTSTRAPTDVCPSSRRPCIKRRQTPSIMPIMAGVDSISTGPA